MVSRVRAVWAKHRKTTFGVVFVIVLVVALGRWMISVPSWPEWTGFGEHNLWDVLDLLIVPIALAIVAYFFRQAERGDERRIAEQRRATDLEIAEDDRREAALQAYFDRMAELLLKEKLRESAPEDEVRAVARARTSTALRRLDVRRNTALIQFLYESDLIANDDRLQLLIGLDLSGANLQGADLQEADLQGVYLQGAILQGAMVTDEQLAKAVSLEGATMPDGTKHD